MADFAQTIATAYAVDGAALDLGRGVHDGAVVPAAAVKLPLRMANRHGLIAGATGTGKTKTLQGLAEQLSAAGVPVFVADVKGDLSGIAEPGEAGGRQAGPGTRLAVSGPGIPYGVLRSWRHRPGDPGPGDGLGLRARAAGQGARRQHYPGAITVPGVPLRRSEGAAAARPVRPARGAQLPRLRRRQDRVGRDRRALVRDGRGAAPVADRARGRGRQRVLRRADARCPRSDAHRPRRP